MRIPTPTDVRAQFKAVEQQQHEQVQRVRDLIIETLIRVRDYARTSPPGGLGQKTDGAPVVLTVDLGGLVVTSDTLRTIRKELLDAGWVLYFQRGELWLISNDT